MTDLVTILSAERNALIQERSKLANEIRKLQSEQASLSDRLFHIEKLLVSYGALLEVDEERSFATSTDDSLSEQDNKSSRPALLPSFSGLSLIEAISKRMADEPERVFETKELVNMLFVPDRTGDQYSIAVRSVTAELSRGAKAGRWYKIPGKRGLYRFEKGEIDTEVEQSVEIRSPKEMKRPQFEKMGYIDISLQVLSQNPQGSSLEDLANTIFEFDNDLEREKAITSLSVELNRAIREDRLERSSDSELYHLPSPQQEDQINHADSLSVILHRNSLLDLTSNDASSPNQ